MWRAPSLRASLFLGLALASAVPVQAEPLDVYTVQLQALPRERSLDAIIESVHQATVTAQTSGRIQAINFDVDDYVTKGDVLIEFRDKPQRAAFNAAQANYKEAQAEYERTKDIYAQKLVAKAGEVYKTWVAAREKEGLPGQEILDYYLSKRKALIGH